MTELSDDAIAIYQSEGYLIIKEPVLNDKQFKALCSYADDLFKRVPKTDSGEEPQLVDCPHWTDLEVFDWLFCDEILDLIEPLTGPDIAVFASHFLRKPPGKGKNVAWHEDSAYWEKRIEPMEVVSLNIAIEAQVRENGCMKVIPGSHNFGYSKYETIENGENEVFQSKIKENQFDESEAVYLETQPNQATIHDARIIHGSEPNNGNTRRCSFAIRYFSAKCKWLGDPETFHIYLARGKDCANNKFADSSRTYEPALLY